MSDSYSWTIDNLEYNSSDGGVFTVHWIVTASRSENTARAYGKQTLNPNPLARNFIAYDDLTEEICVNWIKEDLGEEVASIESSLSKDLDRQENPDTKIGLPELFI